MSDLELGKCVNCRFWDFENIQKTVQRRARTDREEMQDQVLGLYGPSMFEPEFITNYAKCLFGPPSPILVNRGMRFFLDCLFPMTNCGAGCYQFKPRAEAGAVE